MVSRPEGKEMLSRLKQYANARSPMLFTLSGNVTLVTLELLNAWLPMAVTV